MQSIDSLKVLETICVQMDDIHLYTPSCTFSNILGANLVRERSHFLYTALQKAHFINLHLQTSICYFSTIWYQKFQTDTHAKKSTQTFTQVNVFC